MDSSVTHRFTCMSTMNIIINKNNTLNKNETWLSPPLQYLWTGSVSTWPRLYSDKFECWIHLDNDYEIPISNSLKLRVKINQTLRTLRNSKDLPVRLVSEITASGAMVDVSFMSDETVHLLPLDNLPFSWMQTWKLPHLKNVSIIWLAYRFTSGISRLPAALTELMRLFRSIVLCGSSNDVTITGFPRWWNKNDKAEAHLHMYLLSTQITKPSKVL